MPVSRPNQLSYIAERVLELQPRSVLDIGMGFGLPGMLFRQYCDVWNGNYARTSWKTKIDAIEIFDEYITPLQKEIYDTIYVGNVIDILPTLDKYDLIYCGDMIEHLSLEDGKKLIEILKTKSEHIMIYTPRNVQPQGAEFGNEHETHLSQWLPGDFVGASYQSLGNGLFVEYDLRMQKYYCKEMSFYGDKLPLVKYHNKHTPVLFVGLYFEQDYNVFKAHKGRRVIFWNGSDVSKLICNPKWIEIIKCNDAEHYCHNSQLAEELNTIGIYPTIVPLFFGNKEDYQVCYKQSDIPQVFINAHPGREVEYGINKIKILDKTFPYIRFHIYGITGEGNCNIIYHGQIPEIQMDEEIKYYQGCLRFNEHDGMSQIVAKAKLLGLHTIVETELPIIMGKLNELKNRTEPYEFDRNSIKDIKEFLEMIK